MKGPGDLVRAEVLAMKAYHVAPARGMVKLDAMENPYALPSALAAELGECLAKVELNRYPDPTGAALKQRLREAMGVAPELEMLLGNGSDEIIQMLSLALAKPGAVALSPEPSFVMYRMSAIFAGMRHVSVPLRDDFALDEPALLQAIRVHQPAITWFSYPNNPSGNLFAREAILRAAAASPGLVVVDEAYFPFSGGATLLDEVGRHPNLVLVRTLSKLGLAGLRLGFAVGPAPWMREIEKLRPPYNVNVLTSAAAMLLLQRREVFEQQAARIVADRALLERALDTIPGVRRFPSAANFILVRVPGEAAYEGLRARGILVRTFNGSHPLLANCLRLTVGTADENMKLIEALASVLRPQNA